MPDPLIMFGGEEPTTALRAWSHGYRLFAIEDTVLWHLNKNDIEFKDDSTFNPGVPHLTSHASLRTEWSLERVKKILCGDITGYWGATSIDKLHEYEKKNNFNFVEFYNSISYKKR
jgi:hypothetical protein